MGFFGKAPKHPAPDPNLPSVNPGHTHSFWDSDGKRHREVCHCDTGTSHTTPRASNYDEDNGKET
jgi:hypothetical protein